MNGEKYCFRDTGFLIEHKEHINRMASPGEGNVIIRGIISWGECVAFPESVEGRPVTAFIPYNEGTGALSWPGVKKLHIPRFFGRFPERNDLFPDLKEIEVDPENRIFLTDRKMLFKDQGRELFLSLVSGLKEERVIVPEKVIRLGAAAFADSRCEEIDFRNPGIEAGEKSFDRSVWLEKQEGAAYIGDMLYRVKGNKDGRNTGIYIRKGTRRIFKTAFSALGEEGADSIFINKDMKLPGLTDNLIAAANPRGRGKVRITLIRVDEEGKEERFSVPSGIDPKGRELLRKAWDLGNEMPEDTVEHITDRGERLDFAIYQASGRNKAGTGLPLEIIREEQGEAAAHSVMLLDEESLCRLLEKEVFDREALLSMLPAAQDRGFVSAAAHILYSLSNEKAQNTKERA
ncbi:MAG: hypothetical protein K5770_12025 [Lachnospiraceae bacterium]|nr:hypothetical protein [Lachnospiraceae bacterium]